MEQAPCGGWPSEAFAGRFWQRLGRRTPEKTTSCQPESGAEVCLSYRTKTVAVLRRGQVETFEGLGAAQPQVGGSLALEFRES